MDISSLDLTGIGIAGMTATSALLGVVAGQSLTARADRRRRSSAVTQERWASARDAFAELLVQATAVQIEGDSASNAALLREMPADLGERLHRAEVLAELQATPETWAEMDPYVRAVALRANAMNIKAPPAFRQSVNEAIKEMGAHEVLGLEALRDRFVAAARVHLQQEPQQR